MHGYVRSIVSCLAVATAATVLLVPAGSAVGATCADGMRTEAGTCAVPVPTVPLTPAQKADAVKVQRIYDRVMAWLSAENRGTVRPPDDPPPAPRMYVLPEVEKKRIFREGEGNGKKYWTCGPSATRNVIAALYKRRTGRYRDLTEQYFERIEKTTRAGTSRANIAAALNKHLPGLGAWKTLRPRSASTYFGWVMSRTLFGRSVIANVNTGPMEFWNKKDLPHFDFVYGYNTVTNKVRVGEEWDPKYLYGSDRLYGNPYGKHWVLLPEAFEAINNSPIHGIVA